MPESIYKKKRKEEVIDKAVTLYVQGFSTREVSKALAQMGIIISHSTIARGVKKKLSTTK